MPVFGFVCHSVVELEKTFTIFYSHFFTAEGNDESRTKREQAVAAQVAKEYAFRSLCQTFSQQKNAQQITVEPIRLKNLDNISIVKQVQVPNDECRDFSLSSQDQAQEYIEKLQNEAINKLGAAHQVDGCCMIPKGPYFTSSKLLVWKKFQSVGISLIVDADDNLEICMDFIRTFLRVMIDINNAIFTYPQELIQKPDEITIILNSLLPNGQIILMSSAYMRFVKKELDSLLK